MLGSSSVRAGSSIASELGVEKSSTRDYSPDAASVVSFCPVISFSSTKSVSPSESRRNFFFLHQERFSFREEINLESRSKYKLPSRKNCSSLLPFSDSNLINGGNEKLDAGQGL